ncbi:hypothetical protein [Paenibacillus mendelii]|uniref:Uncharacterized protein n=1 Tax=Paenibacillus mendelii TaxID=206163 RepID=A0ABV6JBD9_9BACL|nr:hypothetical protein [Paenibacillus mendelii]MCQ6560757.1 hypothetical protein [Paenibacillus mendelii]
MTTVQRILGLCILLAGSLIGLASGNYYVLVMAITCGFVLMSLSKLIDMNRDNNHRLLGMPLTTSQINQIKSRSPHYQIESPIFDIYPQQNPVYPFMMLDNERYIRAKVFYNYLSQEGYCYTFELPGHESIALHCSTFYYSGVELFEHEDQVFVKISSLPVKLTILNRKIIME